MKKLISVSLCLAMLLSISACQKTVETDVSTETTKEVSEASEPSFTSENVATETTSEATSEVTSETTVEKPYLTEINHYVTSLDEKFYLNDEQWNCFCKAMDAILNYEPKVDLTDSYDGNLLIYGAIKHSPYYFLVDHMEFYKDHTGLNIKYHYSQDEHEEIIRFIDESMLEIINSIFTSDMNELDKVLACNKYFASNIEYDYNWLNQYELSTEKFLFPEDTIYNAFRNGVGVCHTYSYLNEFVLQQVGVEIVNKSSDMIGTEGGHMWNAVKLGNNYYHVDTTWSRVVDMDDTLTTTLQYFGMTTDERRNTGCDYFEIPTDNFYGNIEMNDTRFQDFRNAYDYELLGDHKVKLYENYDNGDVGERIINTEDYLK